MPKLTKMDLPPRGQKHWYCEKCNQFVPWKRKHLDKHHYGEKFYGENQK